MSKFRIIPHSRLQEWVAEEKGYFHDEGLDYEFITASREDRFRNPSIQSADSTPAEVKRGAFESMEDGRACEISSGVPLGGQYGGQWRARPHVGTCLLGYTKRHMGVTRVSHTQA